MRNYHQNTASFYNPFGMSMQSYSNVEFVYMYKHQGQESDDEVYGDGDAYFYTYRMSDSRYGRFWSVDPLAPGYPGWSPYAYSQNRVIDAVELEGLEAHILNQDKQGNFSLTFDPNANPVEDPASQVYFNGQIVDVNEISKQYNITFFDPTPYPKLGDLNYYEFRHNDFKIRAGLAGIKAQPPTYYMNYGDKYIKRFSNFTNDFLSKDGKMWLKNARYNLQYLMEEELMKNPSLELDENKFTQFAFDSHVDAYSSAGIFSLDFRDKAYILATPDASDLLSKLGIKQAKTMAMMQFDYYIENPLTFLKHLGKYHAYQKTEIKALLVAKGVYELYKGMLEDIFKNNP